MSKKQSIIRYGAESRQSKNSEQKKEPENKWLESKERASEMCELKDIKGTNQHIYRKK